MTNRESILNAIEFVESNLQSEIAVSDMAREACCSLYHFIRLFKSITGLSPKKYLLKRRLTQSVAVILTTKKKISSIALDFQFGSNEVFTRAFKKQFNISPSKARKGDNIPTHLLTRAITEGYIFQSKTARNQEPTLVELEKKIIVGTSYFIDGNLKKLELSSEWNSFLKSVDGIACKNQSEQYYQIQYWTDNQIGEGMHFFIGVEVSSLENVHPGFAVKIIPQGKYLQFIHKGLSKNVGHTYRYIYEEFLPDSAYKLTLPFNFEYYGPNYISPYKEDSESHLLIPIGQ